MTDLSYTINPKEKTYFFIKVIVSIILYAVLFNFISTLSSIEISPQYKVLFFYVGVIVLYLALRVGLLIGYLKGNAIKISENQLPEIYEIIKKQSSALGLASVPEVYLLQAGGLLNAFATRFMGTNYVVIYSDILDEAYENNMPTVEFIIGHELGHVKRKHVLKGILLFPSLIIPFLGAAYSRACEYTCDSIGAALSPKGARTGLVLLASGKRLYKKVNIEKFMYQSENEESFWSWFSEKVSSHPKLSKRVLRFQDQEFASIVKPIPIVSETLDHSTYLPKM